MSHAIGEQGLVLKNDKNIVHTNTGLLTSSNKKAEDCMGSSSAEARRADAEARRNLQGNNVFDNLGDPIKEVLLAATSSGARFSDGDLQELSKVSVKQLAKVYEMLGAGEDPDAILNYLTNGKLGNKNYRKIDDKAKATDTTQKAKLNDLDALQARLMGKMNLSNDEQKKKKEAEDAARKARLAQK